MTEIKNIREYTVTGVYDIDASFRADDASDERKRVTLRFKMNSTALLDIITPALSSKRITWVNSVGRKKFDTIKNRAVIELDYASPGTRVKTREESIDELRTAFMKAGLTAEKALELATKAVDNPEIIA